MNIADLILAIAISLGVPAIVLWVIATGDADHEAMTQLLTLLNKKEKIIMNAKDAMKISRENQTKRNDKLEKGIMKAIEESALLGKTSIKRSDITEEGRYLKSNKKHFTDLGYTVSYVIEVLDSAHSRNCHVLSWEENQDD